MTPDFFLETALRPALRLLPEKMNSPSAISMILAVGLQESRFQHRKQIGGPARGYLQFEQGGGVRGVLTHPASKPHIQTVLTALDYDPKSDAEACYAAIEHNDILAAAFGRLLLWTHPKPLPARSDPTGAFAYYLATWRPGRPYPATFPDFYREAWEVK